MVKIDFVKLASYCQQEYKSSLDGKQYIHYRDTQFVAIKDDDSVLVSSTPHILAEAKACILIHRRKELAQTNYYDWYYVQCINEVGEVFNEAIDQEFRLFVTNNTKFTEQTMMLKSASYECYFSKTPRNPRSVRWDEVVKSFWRLYLKLKDVQSPKERELIAALFRKDDKILELEHTVENFNFTTQYLQELSKQYEGILNRIKELLENK